MPKPNKETSLPDWAERERASDLAWIMENVHVFWPAAQQGHAEWGRGALVVDTTSQPVEGRGHPFGYFPQDVIQEQGDDDTQRLVREYDPPTEFVSVLLKPEDRVSSYRLRVIDAEPRENLGRRIGSRPHSDRPHQRQEPPGVETLIRWEPDGYCEATDGCRVEPDGRCSHGHRSRLLELGLI
jgi:hypothetical protein